MDFHLEARRIVGSLSLEQLCGQLLVVGFEGAELPTSVRDAIRAGLRGGVILFKRNLPDLETSWRLCRSIREAFPPGIPPLIAVDEEGGRVSRLPSPLQKLPPMRWFGDRDDVELTKRAARWVGRQLAAIGFTWNFAPVLDVDSNPQNPIIGDRSFSRDPAVVTRHALAFIEGLQSEGIAACGKHFPGHGDTALDSHLELPRVDHRRERLERVELQPFRTCSRADLASMMTAHVVYPALDATEAPATVSHPILADLLRRELGFAGVVFSDDLEMGAIARHQSVESAACRALSAGCDALLLCHTVAAAERALAAMVEHASSGQAFEEGVRQAAIRCLAGRHRFAPIMASDPRSLRQQVEPKLEEV